MPAERALVLDDAATERVIQATAGAAAPCFQCGVCTAVCPWNRTRSEPLSVRKVVRQAQLGVEDADGLLWQCTTCAACQARCPRGVDVGAVMLGLRSLAWPAGSVPKGLPSLMWDVYWDGNPWGQPPSRRSAWSQDLQLKPFEATDDVLYYVGCTASYDRRAQKVARAVVTLLRAAGVSFGVLGDREPCCGDAAHSAGQFEFFEQIAQDNVRLFTEAGARRIVTTSPHCYDVFKSHYPADTGFEVLHYTEYLAQLIEQGRLSFPRELSQRLTYHDPCYLGRQHGVYEAPRAVLSAIPGVTLAEMSQNRQDALCCGGGGGRMWLETEAGQRFGDTRVVQARDTGAEIVVTACPYCITCLEDSFKMVGGRAMRVLDVAEVAQMALGSAAGATPAIASSGRSER